MAGRGGGRDRFPESRGGHGLRRLDSKSGKAPPSRNLWVGNLSQSIVEEDLVNPFLQFGELESVAFHPGRSYAFLKFKREDDAIAAMDSLQGLPVAGNPLRIEFSKAEDQTEENSDEEEAPEITKWESVIWLSILTAWISVLSEYLVNAIEGASVAMGIPVAFISVILLPIVGNAAEHAGAVMFAMKDKLDITLGVAIGSSTQISMFGIPFCVVVGWCMGCPMDLDFQLFETATLFITVLVVAFMLQEGTSNYFKGLMLILCYIIVAASFFVHRDPKAIQDKPQNPKQ